METDEMSIDEIVAEMRAQGLQMEPENNGESVDVLLTTLQSLREDFAAISTIDDE